MNPPTEKNSTKKQIPLYNPMKEDFKALLRDENNLQTEIVMPSRQITYFDPPIADVMKRRLADYIYFQSPMNVAYDVAVEDILHGEDGIEVQI